MSLCLYQYYPFSFFLSSVFLSVSWDVKDNRNNASNSTLCFISLPFYFYFKYEIIYQLDAIGYLFVFFQLDMFRAYTLSIPTKDP